MRQDVMQVVLVRWRPRGPGLTAVDLREGLAAATAPSDRVEHVRVDDRMDARADEWRLAVFVQATSGAAARSTVRALVSRTAAVMAPPPETIDVELATGWFRRPG